MPNRYAIVLIAAYALLIWPKAAFATENPPASVSAQVERQLPGARALGGTRLSVWGFQIYDAKLWVASAFRADDYARTGFALNLGYLRAFSGADIAHRSIKEMRTIGSISDAQAAQWLAQMEQLFPDVRSGDHLLGLYSPTGEASFSLNGKPLGSVRDPEFARLFFGIWLSPQTSVPAMRRALLGLDRTTP
jgi:hypothetical protein